MTLIKVATAEGPVLDWMVAKCEDMPYTYTELSLHIGSLDLDELTLFADCHCEWTDVEYKRAEDLRAYILEHYIKPEFSTNWAFGGPILTREHISRTIDHAGLWIAYWTDGYGEGDQALQWMHCDRSELVTGLRCYVESKLGKEVEVPDELV